MTAKHTFLPDNLSEADILLQAFCDAVDLPLLVLDRQLRVQTINHAAWEQLTLPDNVVHDHLKLPGFCRAYQSPHLQEMLHNLASSKRPFGSLEVQCAGFTPPRDYIVSGRPLPFDDRDLLMLTIQPRAAQSDDGQANPHLNEASRAALQARLEQVLSHKIRSPLTSINIAGEMMALYADSSNMTREKREEMAQRISNQVYHTNTLLDESLLIGYALNPALQPERELTDLVLLCEELADEIGNAWPRHHVLVRAYGQPRQALIDESLIQHALHNLLDNAAKYSPHEPDIQLRLFFQEDEVAIKVQDSGIGIAQAELGMVFEVGVRGSNVDGIPGAGMGLFLARHFIALHDGDVVLESDADQGTTVSVHLPYRPRHAH